MTGNEPGKPATLWKEQAVEGHVLSAHEIRDRLKRLDGRIRVRNRVEYIAGVLTFVVIAAFVIRQIAHNIFDIGTLGGILLLFGVLTVSWQLHRRTGPVVAIDGARPSVEVYCSELRRQRDALASVWLWYVAPFVPGIVTIYAATILKTGTRAWPVIAAVGLAQIGFIAWVIHMNRRAARVLDAELEAQMGRH